MKILQIKAEKNETKTKTKTKQNNYKQQTGILIKKRKKKRITR